MVRVRLLAAALALGVPLAAAAVDAPHEAGALCSKCHLGHNSPGGSLTRESGNFSLCQSCHLGKGPAFGFDWSELDQATPGSAGRSHSWSAHAGNRGATPPSTGSADPGEVEMAERLDGTNLQCSTCHDQHQSDAIPVSGRGSQHLSPVKPTKSGTGSVTVLAPAADATSKQYLVEITVAGDQTSAEFKLSNDKGASWWGCTAPGAYVAYSGSNDCAVGSPVQLNDGARVSVSFAAGTYLVGDRWDFYVSYPYLRADNTDAKMCVTCHRDRHQSHQNVQGSGTIVGTGAAIVLGTTEFSHPVGEGLNANGKGTDLGAPLDASGVSQAAGDGNRSNDLVLSSSKVTCLTCHHPHNADSNSLSDDPR